MDFTIQNVLIPVETGYETVDVQIRGASLEQPDQGCIVAIAPHLDVCGTPVDGRNKLLLPGFVNAHTHSSEIWQRGMIPPRPLELWIAELYDFTPDDPRKLYWSALANAVETLLTGGTTVVDHLVLIPGQEVESVASVIQAYREIGIRAFVGPLIQDQSLTAGIPSGGNSVEHKPYVRSTTETLDLMQELVEKFHAPAAGINIMVAPTGMQLCSDELFEGCIELSDRHSLCRHMHLLESKAQQQLALEKYGCSAVEHLKHLGFLDYRTSLAHCVWLDDADIAILAQTRSTVVHNPLSNLRLGSGIAPILKYLQAGVNVTFGCDGAASNDSQDLLEAIKIGSILHTVTDMDYRHWISPRQAIAMASLGGATGLNMADHVGSLTVGKKADLVMYDLTNLSLLPRTDPVGLLVLGRPSQVVDSVWVNGRRIVADGEVTTIDVPHLKQQLFDQSQWMASRSSPTVQDVERRYRRVMGLESL